MKLRVWIFSSSVCQTSMSPNSICIRICISVCVCVCIFYIYACNTQEFFLILRWLFLLFYELFSLRAKKKSSFFFNFTKKFYCFAYIRNHLSWFRSPKKPIELELHWYLVFPAETDSNKMATSQTMSLDQNFLGNSLTTVCFTFYNSNAYHEIVLTDCATNRFW